MQSSLLNNLCNDNVKNQLFFFTFTNFLESHFQKSKNNPVEVLTGGCPSGFSLGCLHIWWICLPPPYGGTSARRQSVNGRETHEGDIDLMGGGT